GTGGTLVGSGLRLRERHPKLKVVAVEPRASAVLSGGEAGSHAIMGIGPGFVPPHLDAIDIDEVIAVSDEEAVSTCRRLFSEEGLMAGVSSGAAAFAAIALSQRGGAGGPIVTIFPDRGERYFESRLIL
ncbi:MAG: pyridoxal-phosphate dependent enzyme, partial [Terriglobia bacterium]